MIEIIQDSGDRTEFGTGAVRDMHEGKGRCDLMPLGEVSTVMEGDEIIARIANFMKYGKLGYLYSAIVQFTSLYFKNIETAMLEAAIHYENGCRKYGERNWEKGIPLHSFIDSGVRHYLKHKRGDKDERHDRAFIWNMLGAIWTVENKPEMIDIPFKNEKDDEPDPEEILFCRRNEVV